MRENLKRTSMLAIAIAMVSALPFVAIQPAAAQTFQVLYTFAGHSSSANPIAGVTVDQHGNLYGTTAWGGIYGFGTAYKLQRTQSGFIYSDLHDFGNGADGGFPWGGITIAPNGSLYGTAA